MYFKKNKAYFLLCLFKNTSKKRGKKLKKRILIITIFILLTITSLLVGVSSKVTINALLSGNKEAWKLFLTSRTPRTIVIILSASALSISGLIMQIISKNKFISPSTSGTTDAAALGVLIGFIIFANQSIYTKFIFAFVFALLSSILFVFLINKVKFKNIIYIPLIGLMYGGLISSITTLIAYETNLLQVLSGLRLGSFSHIGILNSRLLIILIPPIIFSFIYAARFNIIGIGEEFATNLGINYNRVLYIGLVITSIIAAASFIVVGPLPFIGLIIPNIVSIYYGDNLKRNLVDVALFGSSFVLLNDIFSRLIIFPYEVSVGFTMGITGAVIFIILIFKQVRKND